MVACSPTYKFEGKERDAETNNDDLGARYYTWRLGRWLSADWSSIPAPVPYANLTNPQTLNLYAMVRDNPETFADLDGHHLGFGSFSAKASGNDCAPGPGTACDTTPQPQQQQAQQQNSSESQPNQQPSSWDKTKLLPDDPSKLGPDRKKNPGYKNPNGEEYINDKTGEKLEWNKGRRGPWGPKAYRGRDGWHYTPPGGVRGKQMDRAKCSRRPLR